MLCCGPNILNCFRSGIAIAVFARSAAELGHAHENHILHAITHILVKRSNSLPQIAQQIAQLALHPAFVNVMIPAAAIQKRNLQTNISFE